MKRQSEITVVGSGLIGLMHIRLVAEHARLGAIVDTNPAARTIAEEHGVPWFSDLNSYLQHHKPDGIILATPNRLHVEQGIACIAAGIPVLVEKPIADRAEDAEALVRQAHQEDVALLVGHHRRYNSLIATAKQAISAGQLGDLVSVHGQFWLYKPDEYYQTAWRISQGGGPLYINLIHDVDLARYLCGEIISIQAMESRKTRGLEVEDSMVVNARFDNGALGTFNISDTIPAPWSWEFNAHENPAYPALDTHSLMIGGTHASLSIPDMKLWQHPGKRSWWEAIDCAVLPVERTDPFVRQLHHFCDVIEQRAEPIASGLDGLKTLRVIEAIKQAAGTGQLQELNPSKL